MKILCLSLFAVLAVVQLSVPGSVVWRRQQTLKRGHVWKFKTEPVDPVDAVRGRYIALRFALDQVASHEPLSNGPAYAILKEDENGFAKIDHLSATPVSGDDVVRVETAGWWSEMQHVRFPFDRYWVSEANAPAAEQAYLANSRRGNENAYFTVRVRAGDAAVEQLYLDNQPLPDYLRALSSSKK